MLLRYLCGTAHKSVEKSFKLHCLCASAWIDFPKYTSVFDKFVKYGTSLARNVYRGF